MTAGRNRRFTDAELREAVEEGLATTEIATRFGVSEQAVRKRRKQLGLTTVAAAVAPDESRRAVKSRIDAIIELMRGLTRANLLQDACDRWLRDPENPEQYDVGARAEEVSVIYEVQVPAGEDRQGRPKFRIETRRATLQVLLSLCDRDPKGDPIFGIAKTESKYADPRELILATAQEVRSTVQTAATLAKMLADAKLMQDFRRILLDEIRQASPEVAAAIADRIRRKLTISGYYRGPEALPGPGRATDD